MECKNQTTADGELVKQFIFEAAGISELENDENMFEAGVVNSLFAIQLVTFIEKSFALRVTMDDLDMRNFESIDAICSFITRKTNGHDQPA